MNHRPIAPIAELDERFSRVQYLDIDVDQAGQRIDNYLVARLKGVPRTHIYKLLRKGEVRVNKGRIKADYRLRPGDTVRLAPIQVARRAPPRQLSQGLARQLTEAVLYENDQLLVLNKPPGLAVHAGSGVSLGLIEALRQLRTESAFLELAHRLDRETSGCLLIAKSRQALNALQEAFRQKGDGAVTKVYTALVAGQWPSAVEQVEQPLRKLEHNQGRERIVKIRPDGKPSLTQFAVSARYRGFTLVEARPITGRTHQIRVHAQSVQCPLVGDDKYGFDNVNNQARRLGFKRLFLHAARLAFRAPDGHWVEVEAPLPDDLAGPLERLPVLEGE